MLKKICCLSWQRIVPEIASVSFSGPFPPMSPLVSLHQQVLLVFIKVKKLALFSLHSFRHSSASVRVIPVQPCKSPPGYLTLSSVTHPALDFIHRSFKVTENGNGMIANK